MPNTVLGKYELIRRLAVGGMGELYIARQRSVAVDRLVVLKRLLPDLARNPDFVRQFLDEARVAATLSHPNIVSIYEVGESHGTYVIAMEMIRGITVGQLTERIRAAVPIGVAGRIVRDAADGLAFAHRATDPEGRPLGIVHRDVSPGNLMIDERGVVKLVDFGIARAANRLSKTATGTIKGKWSYMPLEQLSGGDIDARADQYALGVVFWELCTGRRLFPDDNVVRIVRERTIPPPSSLRPVPTDIEAIVLRMVADEAEQRFADCGEVVSALDTALGSSPDYSSAAVTTLGGPLISEEVTSLTADLTPDPSVWELVADGTTDRRTAKLATATEAPSKRRPLWLAGIVVGIAAASLGGLLLWRGEPPSETPVGLPTVAPEPPPPLPEPPEPPDEALPQPKAKKARSKFGFLNVSTEPWSEVWIDGEFRGTTPLHKIRLSAGTHRAVLINRERGLKETKRITVRANATMNLVEKLE